MRVLVVENDPAVGCLLADLLAGEGHAALGARTPDEGLARARTGRWDACLTDGFWWSVGAELRGYLGDLAACCPVILMTAQGWARSARPADLGVAAVVPKPFDLDDLLGALATVASPPPARPLAHGRAVLEV
jgi:DNA-binding response OmpR family regulator